MRIRRALALPVYVRTVTVCGLALLVWLGFTLAGELSAAARSGAFWLFLALVVVGELLPVRGLGRDQGEISVSTPFAFALVLEGGLGPGVVGYALAALACDAIRRRPWPRVLFNTAQCALSMAACGAVLLVTWGTTTGRLERELVPADLPALFLAALVFFGVNNTLAGVAAALEQRVAVRPLLSKDLLFQASTTGVLLGLSPIIVAVAGQNLLLVPLLLLPLGAVYRAARVSLEKEYVAQHDLLTELPNRAVFSERAEAAIDRARQAGTTVAVLLIDLDRFKEVNDTLGHRVGDLLLQQVAPRLRDTVEGDALVARLGGDEFAVVLGDLAGTRPADEVARELLRALQKPFSVEGFSLEVSASMGIACYPEHGSGVDMLIQRADVAMYLAKAGHLGYEVYAPQRDPHSRRRLELAGDLRGALDDHQMWLEYQPIADSASGAVGGVEALVRWRHPQAGVVHPDEFIPLCEQTGLIGPLTVYVLDAALRQCQAWEADGLSLRVSVNLSARNLSDPGFTAEVARLLARHRMDPTRLELEITESTVMTDPVLARRVLNDLAALDVGLSLDDFGTGYTSIAQLRHLPVDEIKIDRSFVQHMDVELGDEVIVHSIIDLSRNLGLRVVAEGVETSAVWDRLVALGCDHVQGYYLARPLPADALAAGLRSGDIGGARPLP